MDVTDEKQVRQAVESVTQQAGPIDVLINCAGAGIAGAVEDTPVSEARQLLEVNFFGTVRVCLAVLPAMRQRRRGLIVNISSLGGLVGLPFQSYYCASKFALEGWSEALRMEVAPFGVGVVLIEPGDFRTGFTDARRRTALAEQSPYQDRCELALRTMEESERNGPDPAQVARLVERIMQEPTPRLRHTVGRAVQRIGVAARHLLPARWFEWGLQKVCGL
jgi:NAD(P)-dependent dehydrogenase (short-subunit alcohol dehydrogenase family)